MELQSPLEPTFPPTKVRAKGSNAARLSTSVKVTADMEDRGLREQPEVPGSAGALPDYVWIERNASTPAGKGQATFVVTGELDIANVDRLISSVKRDAVPGAHLVLDVSRLEFMDCSVVRALVELLGALEPNGRLTVWGPSPLVRRVLSLAGAEQMHGLVIVDS